MTAPLNVSAGGGGGVVRGIEPHGLLCLGDQLITYQSHHHSLFLDQTIYDALGGEGLAVRRQAAFEASHALLASFYADMGVTDAAERLDLASQLFAAMGHGRLAFEVTAEGGRTRGFDLHYGVGFAEKYGKRVKNRRPVDTFAAGFMSAAASLAFPSDWGALDAEEASCVAQAEEHRPLRGREGAEACRFTLVRRPEPPRFGALVTRHQVEVLPIAPPEDAAHPRPAAMRAAMDLAALLDETMAGDDGTIRAFGVRLALVPAAYLDQISYDTVHLVEKRAPELFPMVAALLREAAQLGAFHLLGGVLASAGWQGRHGPPARDVEVRLEQLLGLLPAFGWGAFHAADFIPGRSLVLRATTTHESAYYALRHGPTARSRLFFQQGVALAIMQLLHRVDFTVAQPITPAAYEALFKSGPRWHVEETRSTLRGDRVCEVIVELTPER